MFRRRKRLAAIGLGATVAVAVGLWAWRASTRYHVAEMLDIPALPDSVSDVDCASFGFSDVLERCAFRIAPADFPALLAAHPFTIPPVCPQTTPGGVCLEKRERGMSHDYCCGPKVGPNFRIATEYFVAPRQFEHGGSITVVVDHTRSLVMVDLYIE